MLNNYFKFVFTKEDVTHIPNKEGTTVYLTIEDFNVTTPGVEKILAGLNPSKVAGPDGLPSRILKLLAPQFAPVLTFIFNQSLQTGTLPMDWKTANITPIYKKGDRAEAKNYRPVSLTCICCKALDHVIHSQIMNHFDELDDQLVITMHNLTKMINQRKSVDIIILDFTKAFDTVPHQRLLTKLKYYGINDTLIFMDICISYWSFTTSGPWR